MSNFVKHMPCPQCGSKDNLAEYDDHYYCFGCKYNKRKNDVHSLRKRLNKTKSDEGDVEMLSNFGEIPQRAMKWLLSYGITQEEIDEYGIKWSPEQQLLILIEKAKYWQGRCFKPDSKLKYLSSGSKPSSVYGTGDTLVLVEDVLSAMKIARLRGEYCAMPLLGSSLSYDTEQKLKDLSENVYVWLDRDKAVNAIRIKRGLLQKGFNSRVVITEKDPKEYSKDEIKKYLSEVED